MDRLELTRRAFLMGGAALTAGACLPGVEGQWPADGQALCTSAEPTVTPGDPAQQGRVLETYNPALTSEGKVNPAAVVAPELRKLLLALTGKVDMKGAWARLLPQYQAGQVVGIKVNTLNAAVPTHPEVIRALVDLLREGTGIAAQQVVVWDRRLDELTRAKITEQAVGALVEGTWQDANAKGAGRGYELTAICIDGRNTHLSNILTRRVDHLLNLAVMKRHDLSGYTGVLKNHYGSIDNPGEFHDKLSPTLQVQEKRFEGAIAGLNALTEVHGKTRLWLLDASIGVCMGTTESPADCAPNRLLASLDPVALDVRGRQLRDLMRGAKGADAEQISAGWLSKAEKAGLGSASVTRVDVT